MPKTTSVSGPVGDGASRARHAGQVAFDRLTQSVEAAQVALKDLRKELSKGSRDVLADLETTLKDARKDLRSVRRTVTRDLEQIPRALVSGKPARRRGASASKATAKATAARKTTTAAGKRGSTTRAAKAGAATRSRKPTGATAKSKSTSASSER